MLDKKGKLWLIGNFIALFSARLTVNKLIKNYNLYFFSGIILN